MNNKNVFYVGIIMSVLVFQPIYVYSEITAVWINDGGDKVTQDELRSISNPQALVNSLWDNTKIMVSGAKNEVVAFNLILEAFSEPATNVTVSFDKLSGPGAASIESIPASGDGVFSWTRRQIELFYIRYLEIKGLSVLSYEFYDERHIPRRFQRPWTGEGEGVGTWFDRPDHNKFYPEIAIPLELVSSFNIAAGRNQSIWVDIHIPKNAPSGLYTGSVVICEQAKITHEIPVELTVRKFALPDVPNAKTMLVLGYEDINMRYLGEEYPSSGTSNDADSKIIRDRHFLMAHRHRISLIDSNDGSGDWQSDQPRPEWIPRLDGTLFTAVNGYDGPGVNIGNNVFSIGTFGSWNWQGEGETAMHAHTDSWVNWFETNAPATEYFLYLVDESDDFATTEKWAMWINSNPGPGNRLMSLATINVEDALAYTPSLDIAASWSTVGIAEDWQLAADAFISSQEKRFFLYNGMRPGSGSFAIEDDGVALRELAWGHFKKKIDRWFFWESTYYNNYQSEAGQTNVFQQAQTFGINSGVDSTLGETGWNYSNGDGVLFYPGTDLVYPEESYGIKGPFASLRLKHWRRGIQDVDYLTMAAAIDNERVVEIIDDMIPKVLWEYGVSDPEDPTWVITDISWPTDPDRWEEARAQLAEIIEGDGLDISVTPGLIDFAKVSLGSTSNARSLTVTNAGDADIVLGNLSIGGTDAPQFSIQEDNCSNETLAPAGSCIVDVLFSPTTEGVKGASLLITSKILDDDPVVIGLSGQGVSFEATISGRVSISIAGYEDLSVTNATVYLEGTGYLAQTDMDGIFILDHVPPGPYMLVVTAQDMIPVRQPVTVNESLFQEVDMANMRVYAKGDATGDGRMALDDAIYILQVVSRLRPENSP